MSENITPRRRYNKCVHWLVLEHRVLSEKLGRTPTTEEHRARAHAFVDDIFDEAQERARKAAQKVVRLPVKPKQDEDTLS